ncbi:E3 ubiquitin-protein ligase Topors-like [Cygnus olor]|uniref:E3 ubiquitin-protein ligase Topors-like n=1 Tax=Cygnus olor TaxID=8869 RepID=UPI001ADE1C90|nr:E3 ubiquitin-protein ligase Topors-like [Cygnus olor]XP_040396682.1 E3 ubiquitin-protein ligase Topors-like [Cygnus olor]
MATALDTRCPICLDSWVNPSYVVPCLHRFCFACIQQWAETKPECPLCKGRVSSVVHSVQADDSFKEIVIQPPVEAPIIIRLRGRVFIRYHTAALETQAASLLPRPLVGGLQPHIWASLFREHPALFQPLLPWLCQELGQMFGDNHWEASVVENLVVSNLSLFGLDEEPLVQLLQPFLERRTAEFVHQLIIIAVEQCNEEAHHLLDNRAARGQVGSSAASLEGTPGLRVEQSSSSAVSSPGELIISFSDAFPEGPSDLPSPPIPTSREQEEPQEMSEGPSASRQRSEPALARPRRGQKRRTSSRASSPPNKRPRRHLY